MHPILFQFNYFGEARTFTTYGVVAVIGIFTASFLIIRLARARGLEVFDTVNILALLVAGGTYLVLTGDSRVSLQASTHGGGVTFTARF